MNQSMPPKVPTPAQPAKGTGTMVTLVLSLPVLAVAFLIATSIPLLFGCSRPPSDAEIQRLLVGTWRMDQEPSKTVQNKPDGSYILQLARGDSNIVVKGNWRVKSGFVIATMTNAPSW